MSRWERGGRGGQAGGEFRGMLGVGGWERLKFGLVHVIVWLTCARYKSCLKLIIVHIVCVRSEWLYSCILGSGLRAAIGCAFSYIHIFDIVWIGLR